MKRKSLVVWIIISRNPVHLSIISNYYWEASNELNIPSHTANDSQMRSGDHEIYLSKSRIFTLTLLRGTKSKLSILLKRGSMVAKFVAGSNIPETPVTVSHLFKTGISPAVVVR